jgi:hypothetical protein
MGHSLQAAEPRMTDRRQPMVRFDPTKPSWVHERLNEVIFAWPPIPWSEWRRLAAVGHHGPGVVNFDGLLFDGWWPWDARPERALEGWLWS